MKTHNTLMRYCNCSILGLAWFFIDTASAVTLLPDAPVLNSITTGTNIVVSVNDPANHVWILERSVDFQQWSEVAAWKVYNGNLHGSFVPETPAGFFRAYFDPRRDTVLAETDTALRLPSIAFNYADPPLPPIFFQAPITNQDNMPATNVTSDTGATLGRVLFYDKRLSTNQTISCSSCHQQSHGFSDPRRFSTGLTGG